MKTFKALGALLAYPEQDLIDALPQIEAVLIHEGLLKAQELAALRRLFDQMQRTELMTQQERYVDLFDRVRSLSLHLFEHVHGESRDRGQAMVDLASMYARAGLELAGHELPDYLPAVLEYLERLPVKEARAHLKDAAHIFDSIAARLARRGSHYVAVFQTLLALAGQRGARHEVVDEADIRREDDPAELDRLWAEQPAFGGAAQGGLGGTACAGAAQSRVSVIQFHRGAAR